VRDKRKKFQRLHKTGLEADKVAYRAAKQLVTKAITKSKDEERCKFIEDLDLNYRRGRMFRLKNRLIKENKDVLGSRGIKNAAGNCSKLAHIYCS